MTLEETIKLKLERLDTIPNQYGKDVLETMRSIYSELLESLEQLTRDENGNIKKTQRNLATIEDIMQDLEAIFKRSDYIQLSKDFISEFDEQADITDEFFLKQFAWTDEESFNRKALDKSKSNAYDLLASNPTVTTNLYQPVREILTNAVIAGDQYTKVVAGIRQQVQGGTIKGIELQSKLYRYAKQMAFDVFAIADRGYTQNISEDIGVEFYVYRGGLVEDSREFCKTRNGKYYHRKEVEAWGNLKRWDGKIPDTDSKTIWVYAGGYRCNHAILPTSEAVVPKDVLERNIASGNYNPDEETRKALGL